MTIKTITFAEINITFVKNRLCSEISMCLWKIWIAKNKEIAKYLKTEQKFSFLKMNGLSAKVSKQNNSDGIRTTKLKGPMNTAKAAMMMGVAICK